MTKAELRRHLRSLHQGKTVRDEESRLTCAHILHSEVYQSARVLGGYWPLEREIDVIPILADALACGKTLLLPRCEAGDTLTLRQVDALADLVPGPFGLLEPAADAPLCDVRDADLLLVPLEGIDPAGMRLGKGLGYYDRLLQGAQVFTLGCALSWQWTAHVPSEPWDIPLCACADARGVHPFPHKQND